MNGHVDTVSPRKDVPENCAPMPSMTMASRSGMRILPDVTVQPLGDALHTKKESEQLGSMSMAKWMVWDAISMAQVFGEDS